MSYSLDFRKQVFKIKKQEKLTNQAVCKRFGISTRTFSRWKQNLIPVGKRNKPVKRAEFQNQLFYYQQLEQRNIIYIDESGFATHAQEITAIA